MLPSSRTNTFISRQRAHYADGSVACRLFSSADRDHLTRRVVVFSRALYNCCKCPRTTIYHLRTCSLALMNNRIGYRASNRTHACNSLFFALPPHSSDVDGDLLKSLSCIAEAADWEMLTTRVVCCIVIRRRRFVAGRQRKLHVRSARTEVEYHGRRDTLHIHSRYSIVAVLSSVTTHYNTSNNFRHRGPCKEKGDR